MAKSKFEYVKNFEIPDPTIPNTYLLVRIDGKGFTKFCETHKLEKPNDIRLISLMNKCARHVMKEFNDIMLAYGQSDEFSFLFRKSTNLYNRRSSKILSTLVSMFSTAFVFYWPDFFSIDSASRIENSEFKAVWPETPTTLRLAYPPAFDSRLVVYPSDREIRDYFSWRQADCHINNLYNTCFWKLVLEQGLTPKEANSICGKSDSAGKNEMLYSQFSTNYNTVPSIFRKGSTLLRLPSVKKNKGEKSSPSVEKKDPIQDLHGVDIISKAFWEEYPFLTQVDY